MGWRLKIATGLALTGLLAGCGSASRSASSPSIATHAIAPARTSAQSSAATSAPTPTVAAKARPADFVFTRKTTSGDKVRVEGRLGKALSASESDADQAALQDCGVPNGRELVVRVDLTVTVESGLAARVMVLLGSGLDEANLGNSVLFLVTEPTPSCHPENREADSVELAHVQPHAPTAVTIWAILVDAITPNDPHPSPKTLGQQWHLGVPDIVVNTLPATQAWTASGRRLFHCRQNDAQEYSSPIISLAGELPSKVEIRGPGGEHRLSCVPVSGVTRRVS
jgi:hypothetical protein